MKRRGKNPLPSMPGVGAYPAPEHRMHAVVTCACANVLYAKKGAMVSVTLNRTMAQAMNVENAACAS
jgi:hypothetical protein